MIHIVYLNMLGCFTGELHKYNDSTLYGKFLHVNYIHCNDDNHPTLLSPAAVRGQQIHNFRFAALLGAL